MHGRAEALLKDCLRQEENSSILSAASKTGNPSYTASDSGRHKTISSPEPHCIMVVDEKISQHPT